jgi:hypothetical protein
LYPCPCRDRASGRCVQGVTGMAGAARMATIARKMRVRPASADGSGRPAIAVDVPAGVETAPIAVSAA